MSIRRRADAERSTFAVFVLALCAFVLVTSTPASAAGIVAKDGRIHACYKAKGKGKGTLRVVRNGKVKCPKKWKKTSWNAAGPSGTQGEAGAQGSTGEARGNGLPGVSGATGTVVTQLEDKITELLTRIEQLEALIPTVAALCSQASVLTTQMNTLEEALGGLKLNTVLTTLGGLLEIPTLPGALPSFSCP